MKRKMAEKYMAVLLVILCCITGCGSDGGAGESGDGEISPRRERTEYDLKENTWKEEGKISESGESWTVTDYWEDGDPEDLESGMNLAKVEMAADGQDYYILKSYEGSGAEAGFWKCYLTRLNLLTLESQQRELKFSAAEDSSQEGIRELAEELTGELAENWLVINGISVVDGKVNLTAVQMDRESKTPLHYYRIWMNEQGEMERTADLLPEIKEAGLYHDGILPAGLICHREGYFIIGVEEASTGMEPGIFDEEGKFIKKLESPNGAGNAIFCTCRLEDGSPVFECMDRNSDKTTIFYFDGQEEQVLYHGECESAWTRGLNGYGEILYLGNGGILLWDGAAGGCRRIYQSTNMSPAFCKGIKEVSDDSIVVVFGEKMENYAFRLRKDAVIEQETLRIYQMTYDTLLKDLAEEYSIKHPGVRIEITERDNKEDEDMILNRLMAELSEGKGPDILVLPREQMTALQGAGALAELSEVLPEDALEQIFPTVRQYGTTAGGLYGISYSVSVNTLMVSNELWKGDTWTYRDVIEVTENNKNIERVIDNFTAGMLLRNLVLLDMQMGKSSLINLKDSEGGLDTEEFARVLEFCRKYGAETGTYVLPEEVKENIRNHKTLAYGYGGGLAQFSSDMAGLGEDFHYVGLPTESDCKGVVSCAANLCLNGNSENRETAQDFLCYVLSYGVQKKAGSDTVRRDVLTKNVREGTGPEDPPAFVLGFRSIQPLTGKPDGSSYLPEYLEILEEGWSDLGDNTITDIILEEAEAYFSGDKTVEETAKVIQSRVWVYLNENR